MLPAELERDFARRSASIAARSGAIFPRRSPTTCRWSSATAASCARARLPPSTKRGALRDESRRVIADMQAAYAEETGVKQLKIKHNNFLGYYIETPQAQGEALLKAPLNARFIHRQTMAGALRFTTNALVDLEAKIASAADRALALELDAFERLRQACLARGAVLRGFGAALAEIDVAAALAELAVKRDWTRPACRRLARLPRSRAGAIRWSRRR